MHMHDVFSRKAEIINVAVDWHTNATRAGTSFEFLSLRRGGSRWVGRSSKVDNGCCGPASPFQSDTRLMDEEPVSGAYFPR